MSIFDQLYPASFNGAQFFVEGTQTLNGGRKTVKFEYPNSDKRAIEDMGQLPDSFEMEAIVFGNNYLLNRNALRLALNIPGSGILIHPFYGVLSVVAQPYTISENLNDLGVAKFSLKFEKAQPIVFPSGIGSTLSLIGNFASEVQSVLSGDLSSIFSVLGSSTENFLSADGMVGSLISDISDALPDVSSFLPDISDVLPDLSSILPSISASDLLGAVQGIVPLISTYIPTALSIFTATISGFQSGAIAAIFGPSLLATNLFNSINTLMNVTNSPTNGFASCQSLFTYGDNFISTPPTTTDRVQNAANQAVLVSTVQTAALATAYVQAAQIPFQNRVQLEFYKLTLEGQYQKIYNSGNLSSGALSSLQDLRNAARQFFDNIEANVLNVTLIQQNVEIPMVILGYQYYGDIDHTSQLLQINSNSNPSFVSGPINILAAST